LTGIEGQMTTLQTRQQSLEDEVRHATSSSSSPGSSSDAPSKNESESLL